MLRKKNRIYLKNKLNNCIKIKKIFRSSIVKSFINNNALLNKTRMIWLLKYNNHLSLKTIVNDVCMISGVRKKSQKWTNLSRHEFHKLCRTNKLTGYIVNSW